MIESYNKIELGDIEKILQEEGYKPSDNYDTQFRYTILKDPEPTVFICAKIFINAPIISQPPLELVAFYCCYIFRPRWLDVNFLTLTRAMAVTLKETALSLPPYPHDFNFEKYRDKIGLSLERYFPKQDSTDSVLLNSEKKAKAVIRDRILHNAETLEENSRLLSQDILEIYKDFHLKPIETMPPEISKGLIRARKNSAISFSNEAENEFLLVEPGSVSYWRDFLESNVWIRTGMETLSVNIWYEAFQDQQFRMNYLLYDWMIYCRGLIKPLLSNLDAPQFEFQDLLPINKTQYIQDLLIHQDIPGLFLPRIVYDNQQSPDKLPIDLSMFESPPGSLEELSIIENMGQAEILAQKGNSDQSKELYNKAYQKLKKYHHTNGQIKALFALYELAKNRNELTEVFIILNEALDISKSGKVSVSDIIQIHLSLAYTYAIAGKEEQMADEFLICMHFLDSLPSDPFVDNNVMRVHLEMAKIRMKQKKYDLANEHFKSLYKNIKKNPYYEFLYYYERSFYYEAIGKEQKQLLSLQKAIEIQEGPAKLRNLAHFELGKIYLYKKKEAQKAIQSLTKAEQSIQTMDPDSIRTKVQTYEMLADAYRSIKDDASANNAKDEAERNREILDRIA